MENQKFAFSLYFADVHKKNVCDDAILVALTCKNWFAKFRFRVFSNQDAHSTKRD